MYKQKTTQELIEDYNRILQIVDLQFYCIIKYGFIIFGQTKCGKTAACHLLSGNVLKGVKIGGQDMVQIFVSKYKNAKIGNAPCSQTHHPNIFQTKHPNNQQQKAYIIDTPGYGGKNGIFRLLENGYSHYQVFSKIQNMKFILCFDPLYLKNTAQLLIDTIVQFTSYFKNYKEQRHQIWKSCVFLFTKVDETCLSLNDLKLALKEISNSIKIQKRQQQVDLIKQFILYIVENDKLFIIKKYKVGESASTANLLKSIDQKASWWSRQFDHQKQNEVQMPTIYVNITKRLIFEILCCDFSKQWFMALIDYYNERVNQIFQPYNKQKVNFCSLDSIISELIKDAMGPSDSHNFLNLMKRYVDKYYHIYDSNYQQQREKLIKQTFEDSQQTLSLTNSVLKQNSKFVDKNYTVKKFNSLQTIEKHKDQLKANYFNKMEEENKSKCQIAKQQMEIMSESIKKIIRQLKKVAYKKRNIYQIVYKYGYIINCLIKQINTILILTQGQYSLIRCQLSQVADNKSINLHRPFKDFIEFNYFYKDNRQYRYPDIQSIYIKNLDVETVQKSCINLSYIELISKFQITYQIDLQVVKKIIIFYQKYIEQNQTQLQDHQLDKTHIIKLVQYLASTRQHCHDFYCLAQEQNRRYQLLFLTRKITNNLGKLLLKLQKYELARKVYDSILFVDTVCNIYKKSIQQLSNPKQYVQQRTRKLFRLKMEYSNYVESHLHQNEIIIILQQCFEHAQDMNELKEVIESLNRQFSQKYEKVNHEYEKNILLNNLVLNMDNELIDGLQSLSINE